MERLAAFQGQAIDPKLSVSDHWRMSVAMFDDSFARLDWVRRLCQQARDLVAQVIDEMGARPYFDVEETVVGDVRYLRLTIPPPPDDLGFLIADISVDGKSCLDMAVQAVVDALQLGWTNPEFPLVDDLLTPTSPPRSWAAAKSKLPSVYWEAIRGVQPHQPTTAYGSWDVPAYYTGWELQQLTNVNKHRNLTPAVFASSMRTVNDDYHADPWESPWPTEEAEFVLRGPAQLASSEIIERAQPEAMLELRIKGGPRGGYAFPGVNFDDGTPLMLPIRLDDYLGRVPKFVELSLRRLKGAMGLHRLGSTDVSGLPFDWSL